MKKIKVRHRKKNALSELVGKNLEEYRKDMNWDLEMGRRMIENEKPKEDHPKIECKNIDLDKNGKGTTLWKCSSKEKLEEILNKLNLPYSDLEEV